MAGSVASTAAAATAGAMGARKVVVLRETRRGARTRRWQTCPSQVLPCRSHCQRRCPSRSRSRRRSRSRPRRSRPRRMVRPCRPLWDVVRQAGVARPSCRVTCSPLGRPTPQLRRPPAAVAAPSARPMSAPTPRARGRAREKGVGTDRLSQSRSWADVRPCLPCCFDIMPSLGAPASYIVCTLVLPYIGYIVHRKRQLYTSSDPV